MKNKQKLITFKSDRVKIKSGHRVDNSGEVIFEVGEYELKNIVPLVTVLDKEMTITVDIQE